VIQQPIRPSLLYPGGHHRERLLEVIHIVLGNFPVPYVACNDQYSLVSLQSINEIVLTDNSISLREFIPRYECGLTYFDKGDPEVLKNTSGKFLDLTVVPLRITETQITKHESPLRYGKHVHQNAEEFSNLDGEFSLHICNMDLQKCELRVCGATISAET
jgi:hypothetical protein